MNLKLLLRSVFFALPLLAVSVTFARPPAPVVDVTQNNPEGEQVVANDQPSQASTAGVQNQPVQSSSRIIGAPVTTNEPSPTVTVPEESALTVSQRLGRLQQQVNNLTNMNLPQQIAELQQQLAQLRGQLQVQSHDLKLLNDQQRSFYQDLDQRINQLKNLSSGSSNTSGNSKSGTAKSTTSTGSPASNNINMKDSSAYQAAFILLTKKQYDKSQAAFQGYLNDYPNGKYVSNAHYWLGEIFLAQKNNKQAEKQFHTVITSFKNSPKVPDAKLKLAIIHAGEGKIKQARQELMRLKKQHPGSTAAQLASIRLQQLNEQSNAESASSS